MSTVFLFQTSPEGVTNSVTIRYPWSRPVAQCTPRERCPAVSNDDKRRRRDGSTEQLSVADLIARREAETQPIPRITEVEPETVRFKPAANLSGRELHITELLRREGRAGEEERGGGLSVPKLVAMAGGGVVLATAILIVSLSVINQ